MDNETTAVLMMIFRVCVAIEIVLIIVLIWNEIIKTKRPIRRCPHGYADDEDCPDCDH